MSCKVSCGFDLLGCPKPNAYWECVVQPANNRYALVGGQYADLRDADFTGADLSRADFIYSRTYDLKGCPAALPAGWECVAQPANGRYALIGRLAQLTEANLSGATIHYAQLADAVTDSSTTCPNGSHGPCR